MLRSSGRALFAVVVGAVLGCGGGGDGSGPAKTISVTAAPPSLTVQQGGNGTVTVTLVRGGGFDGAVNVTVDGLPTGVTLSVSPTQLTGTTTSATVTVNVAASVAPGTYTATVHASATGVGSVTTSYTLTVTAIPNYALTATPAAVTIPQGLSEQTTIGVQRTNFTGAVNLALDAPPAGITATFNPAAPTTNSSIATIAVAANVTPGNYNVTIKGTATGVPSVIDAEGAEVAAAEVAAAAGDRTTTVAVTVAPASDFTISANPTAMNVSQGGTGNSTVSVVRMNLTTDIALSLVSPPAGITGVFTPATLTGATLQSALVISVAQSVTPNTYNVTVQGAAGTLTKTVVIAVTVASGPTVSLVASPATLSIEQGLSGTSTLTATRTNYNGNITPSYTGNPAGMTVTFNPNPLPANTSEITVNVGSGVAPSVYNLTITGTTTGAGTPTTPLQVTVTAPTGSNITWEFCNADDVPIMFWRLSGTTWTAVAPTVVGNVTRFPFTISSSTGGVAYTIQTSSSSIGMLFNNKRQRVQRTLARQALQRAVTTRSGQRLGYQVLSAVASEFETFVFFATTTELQGSAEVCPTAPVDVTKHFDVTGQASGEEGLLGYGGASTGTVFGTTGYDIMLPAGTYDWLGLWGPMPQSPTFEHNWSGYRVGRGEAVPGAAVPINRVGAPAFTTFPFTVTGGGASSFWSFSELISGARGALAAFQVGPLVNTTGTGNLFFMQPGDRLGTDLVSFDITNLEDLGGGQQTFRSSTRYLGSGPPGSGTFALNQNVPGFSTLPVSGAPVPTWVTSGTIPTDYQGSGSSIGTSFVGAGDGAFYTIAATRAWLIANSFNTSFTLTGPTLPGFQSLWAPAAPLDLSSVIMFGSDFTTVPVAGSVFNLAIRTQIP